FSYPHEHVVVYFSGRFIFTPCMVQRTPLLRMKYITLLTALVFSVLLTSCGHQAGNDNREKATASNLNGDEKDWHTLSNADSIGVSHLSLDITVDFQARKIQGSAQWQLARHSNATQVV